jgi:SPP1 family predicted phage head-tail adaptor
MKIADLRHRILLQGRTLTQHPEDFEEEVFQDYMRPWAKAENLYGSEYFTAMGVKAENTVKYTIRYLKNIDTTMRILFNEKSYQMTFIDNIKYSNKFMELKAVEAIYKPCTVFRNDTVKGNLNRPEKALKKIGVYQCIIKTKSSSYTQDTPQAVMQEKHVILGSINMKVEPGDVIEIDGNKYISGVPVKLLDRHIEVEINLQKEVK